MCCTSKGSKTGKGKCAAEAAPNPNPNTASIGIIPSSEGEGSAASFQGPDVLATEQRVQPARKAKLMCIPIVDSDIEHQLEAPGSCNSRGSSTSSSNGDSSSEAPAGNDSDNISGGSTVSANDSDSSSSPGSNTETPSRSKKYRRVVVHSGKEVVEVGAMSSDACSVRMLSEGEYNVHTSS